MQIIDAAVLAEIRELPCAICGRPGPSSPHHFYHRKGMGGAGHIDHRYNVLPVCLACHDRIHYEGRPTRQELLALVARRERVSTEWIIDTLNNIRRT